MRIQPARTLSSSNASGASNGQAPTHWGQPHARNEPGDQLEKCSEIVRRLERQVTEVYVLGTFFLRVRCLPLSAETAREAAGRFGQPTATAPGLRKITYQRPPALRSRP